MYIGPIPGSVLCPLAMHGCGRHATRVGYDDKNGDVFLEVFTGATVRELTAGETLFQAGEIAEQVFNIVSGTLMVSRIGKDGRRQVMSFLFKNNFVGLTSADHYFFSVEAVTQAQVSYRSRQSLETHLQANSAAERTFRDMVLRVLENSLDLVYSLGQRTAIERLAVFLLYLRHRHRISAGITDDHDRSLDTIELPMSRQDIADFLGLKKETVSRCFTELDNRGLIGRPGSRHAVIQQLDELRDLAGVVDFSSPLRRVVPQSA
jgi:CRP/FNR family transcriptional regulator